MEFFQCLGFIRRLNWGVECAGSGLSKGSGFIHPSRGGRIGNRLGASERTKPNGSFRDRRDLRKRFNWQNGQASILLTATCSAEEERWMIDSLRSMSMWFFLDSGSKNFCLEEDRWMNDCLQSISGPPPLLPRQTQLCIQTALEATQPSACPCHSPSYNRSFTQTHDSE